MARARDRHLRHLRRRRHLRQRRPARRGLRRREDGPDAVEPVSTQVIPRDRHAMYLRHARRRRLVASSGWRPRSATCSAPRCWRPRSTSRPGQKGSSAMPHKRNPVLTENLTGLARLVRSAVRCRPWRTWRSGTSATSRHSSVERMIGPDATVHLDFALRRLAGVIDKLVVYPENMREEPRPPRRPGPLAARAAGADPEGRRARGRLPPGPAQRHEGLARRRATSSTS